MEKQNMQRKENSRKAIVLLSAGILLTSILLALSLYQMLSNYQNRVIEGQTQQMTHLVRSVTNSIEVYVEEYRRDLRIAAGDISHFYEDMEVDKESLLCYLREQVAIRGNNLGCAFYETAEGERFFSAPFENWDTVREMYSDDEGEQMELVRTGQRDFYLRLSAKTVSGGRLSFFLDIRAMYEQTASYITLGENGYIMLKASDGMILNHPVEEQIGIDVIDDRQAEYPDFDLTELAAMVDDQLAGKTGTAIYESYWWAEEEPSRVRKISSYEPAHLGNDFIVVSAVIDYSELSIPIRDGMVRILAVAGSLGAMLILLLVGFVRVMLRMRSYEAENARLRQLNEQLEALREKEERLAHQQRLQLLGTMTGGIAHEFNNLLTPIMGYSVILLADTEPTSERYADLQEIYDSAKKAKEIIDQLSQFSGKNAEKTFRSLPITQVIHKAMVMVNSIIPRHIRLENRLSDTEAAVWGNPTQITQILLNLCNNAIHAMKDVEQGELVVESQILTPDKKKHPFFRGKEKKLFYRLSIRDNGCGMSEETLAQIYVPFFTTKKAGEGTGLGLSIVQRIVEAHHGLLCVTSAPGEGTEFVVYLPLERPSEETIKGGKKL
ncbi:ATP-binding protein [Hominifimenecus sp. rT4P-3]|uniref:ATP-binding protein n=1 Tax=Hominifimenecus sp. rT4P-3 TaxID=3242979 RepID=UPI003DA59196